LFLALDRRAPHSRPDSLPLSSNEPRSSATDWLRATGFHKHLGRSVELEERDCCVLVYPCIICISDPKL
jgi:hypothetical protein